jgi:hypothetical protein
MFWYLNYVVGSRYGYKFIVVYIILKYTQVSKINKANVSAGRDPFG